MRAPPGSAGPAAPGAGRGAECSPVGVSVSSRPRAPQQGQRWTPGAVFPPSDRVPPRGVQRGTGRAGTGPDGPRARGGGAGCGAGGQARPSASGPRGRAGWRPERVGAPGAGGGAGAGAVRVARCPAGQLLRSAALRDFGVQCWFWEVLSQPAPPPVEQEGRK